MQKTSNQQFSVKFLYVAVFTMVTILLWIGFEVIRSLFTPSVPPQLGPQELVPLERGLNQNVLAQLKSRRSIPQEELDAIEVATVAVSFQKPVIQASESATIEGGVNELAPQAEATQSGGI